MGNDPENIEVTESYCGFEQGPIRPPSEAASLLIRVTRNCPFNRCTFCPVYKGSKFSVRPVKHVLADIDKINAFIEKFKNTPREKLNSLARNLNPDDEAAFIASANWYYSGEMKSVFLQDANSLIIKPSELIEILNHLHKCFLEIERITSYARSHTISRISDKDLKAIREAGLNRIHIGMESGSNEILKIVKKGVTKEQHISAGRKIKKAGIQLSEYWMPGLGGKSLSKENALETADAMNQINPDFIRLRTLAVPENTPLHDELINGSFIPATNVEIVNEMLLFLEHLEGIYSYIMSDHILNLFEDFEGKLPDEKERLTGILKTFLKMSSDDQVIFQIGRRKGIFHTIDDMHDPIRLSKAKRICVEYGVTSENVDEITQSILRMYI